MYKSDQMYAVESFANECSFWTGHLGQDAIPIVRVNAVPVAIAALFIVVIVVAFQVVRNDRWWLTGRVDDHYGGGDGHGRIGHEGHKRHKT